MICELSKLDDNISLVNSKIKEQTPLIKSIDQKIRRKQEDINTLEKELKKVNTKLRASDIKYENVISQNEKKQFRLILNYIGIILIFCFVFAYIDTQIIEMDDDYMGIMYLILGIFPFIHWFYKKRVRENLLYEIEDEEEPFILKRDKMDKNFNDATKELNELKEEFSVLSNDVEFLKIKKEIIKSVIPVNKVYDADNNNDLDVAETSNIELIIKQKQTTIRKIEQQENRNYLKDFTKINIFLDSFKKQLIDDYEDIQSFCNIENSVSLSDAQQKIETFESNITSYKALMSSLVLMISNLVNDDLVSFFKLYDIFDKLSVFESNYEKKVIQGFRDNANLTKQLIKATHDSRDAIENELKDVGYKVDDLQFEIEWLGKKSN